MDETRCGVPECDQPTSAGQACSECETPLCEYHYATSERCSGTGCVGRDFRYCVRCTTQTKVVAKLSPLLLVDLQVLYFSVFRCTCQQHVFCFVCANTDRRARVAFYDSIRCVCPYSDSLAEQLCLLSVRR